MNTSDNGGEKKDSQSSQTPSSDTSIPGLHTYWLHHSGAVYVVYDLTNLTSGRPKFPPSISYRNVKTAERYSRRLDEWHKNFTQLDSNDPRVRDAVSDFLQEGVDRV